MLALEQVAQRAVGMQVPAEQLPGPSTGSITTAPAPSPTITARERSSQSVTFERVSEPMSRMGPDPAAMSPATVTIP